MLSTPEIDCGRNVLLSMCQSQFHSRGIRLGSTPTDHPCCSPGIILFEVVIIWREQAGERERGVVASRVVRSILAMALSLAVAVLTAAPASAHSELIAIDPAPDSVAMSSPGSITLTFNQQINPEFATVSLSDSAQRRLTTTETMVTGQRVEVAVTAKLPAGRYSVAYRVVSADGHPISGQSAFTVVAAPATPASAAVGQTTSASAPYDPANPRASEGPRQAPKQNWVLIGVMSVLGLAVGTIGVLLMRRGRNGS